MSFVADMDILAEEQADQQRVVEERHIEQLVAITKQERAKREQEIEEEERLSMERARENKIDGFIDDLAKRLKITVPRERVRLVGDEFTPTVEFADLTFAKRDDTHQWSTSTSWGLVLRRECRKRCSRELWVRVPFLSDLVKALEDDYYQQHQWDCLVRYDEEGNQLTDAEGNEIPTRAALDPAPRFELVPLNPVVTPAERYTAAVRQRRHLQFERAKVKELALRRILANKGVVVNGESFVAGSASAAEKLVEFDEEYAAHCAALTDAVIEEITAREVLIAADGKPGKEDEET